MCELHCNQSSLISVEGMPDDKGYDVALNAMEVLQIKTDEQLVVLHTIAALLHWGNIEFSVAAYQSVLTPLQLATSFEVGGSRLRSRGRAPAYFHHPS